jgi:hypothetical protein
MVILNYKLIVDFWTADSLIANCSSIMKENCSTRIIIVHPLLICSVNYELLLSNANASHSFEISPTAHYSEVDIGIKTQTIKEFDSHPFLSL